jgi:hypothetical protein
VKAIISVVPGVGRRVRPIEDAEVQALVKRGEAKRVNSCLYEQIEKKKSQQYATREMRATDDVKTVIENPLSLEAEKRASKKQDDTK